MITQANTRTIIATVFNVPLEYVIPRQGNWFNPQDKENLKYKTWIAYTMDDETPRVLPFMQQGNLPNQSGVGSEISTSYDITRIRLQMVGKDAEILSKSVRHWLNNTTIINLFDSYKSQLLAQDLGRCTISNFIQDGLNSVIAYNVDFRVQYANMFEITETAAISATINGDLTVNV